MLDFLVIGGGIAGLSAAARLSALGSVLLLEAESALGYHSSGRSAAMFEENYGRPSTVALNRASKSFLMQANGGVLSPRGLLMVAGHDQAESFEREVTDMHLDRISPAEARDMIPILDIGAVAGAAYHDAGWDIDTHQLIQNFAAETRRNGGTIQTGQRIDAVRRADGRWQVRAGSSDWQARVLVNAAGAWADQVAAMAGLAPVGLTPLRRSMARIPAPGGLDVAGWPMLHGAGEAWYCKPDAGKLIVSPSEEDPSFPHDAWPEDLVLAEGLARYEAFVTEAVRRVESSWAGLRTFAPDRCLVLGPDPEQPDFVWVAGQGGYGFQTSAAASRLVADLVAGSRPELPADIVADLSPARFRGVQA